MAVTDAELALLGLLAEQARHGYELETVITQRGLRQWTAIAFSSIYYVLDRLHGRGLVEPDESEQPRRSGPARGRKRVTYRITDAGRAALSTTALEAITRVEPTHDRVLVGLAGLSDLADPAVTAALRHRQQGLREVLDQVDNARRAQQPLPDTAEAIFDYAEARLRADISWTEATMTRSTRTSTRGPTRFDVRTQHRDLYRPPRARFELVEVPPVDYLSIDGAGDPNTATAYSHAVEALYSTAYTIKFAQRATGRDIAVGPLEGLWRASDPRAFTDRTKDAWWWTMLLPQPPFVTAEDLADAVSTVRRKKPHLDPTLIGLSLRQLHEGTCLQTMHVGAYDDEGPTLQHLHDQVMPDQDWTFAGDHHEIYLNDARRTAPERLRTILRQPVRPLNDR